MPRGLVSPLRTRQRPCCPLRTRQALFTWLLMGQRQSAARLVGICVVVAGLGLPMMEYRHSDGAGTEDIVWGIALTFGGFVALVALYRRSIAGKCGRCCECCRSRLGLDSVPAIR